MGNVFFLLSITFVHFCFLLLITSLICLVIPTRIFLSLLILIAAVVGYFSDNLNIVIDTEMAWKVILMKCQI